MKKIIFVVLAVFLIINLSSAQNINPDSKTSRNRVVKKNIYSIGLGGIPPYLSAGVTFNVITTEDIGLGIALIYLPLVGQWDDTKPEAEFKNDNNAVSFLFSPSYYLVNSPTNRWRISVGPYVGAQLRIWKKYYRDYPGDSINVKLQDGNVVGFHYGLAVNVGYKFYRNFGANITINTGVKSVNSFASGILAYKLQLSGLVTITYDF